MESSGEKTIVVGGAGLRKGTAESRWPRVAHAL
jgi:hypothetical protein